MEKSWFPSTFYLFALGQVFNTDILHVAFCVEVIELDIAGHLRDGPGPVICGLLTKPNLGNLSSVYLVSN